MREKVFSSGDIVKVEKLDNHKRSMVVESTLRHRLWVDAIEADECLGVIVNVANRVD